MMLADAVVQTAQTAFLHGNAGVGLVGGGAAIGIGLAGFGAALATGRNPGAFGKIFIVSLLSCVWLDQRGGTFVVNPRGTSMGSVDRSGAPRGRTYLVWPGLGMTMIPSRIQPAL